MAEMRFGIIQEVDKGKVKVRFDEDDLVSDWLPVSVFQTKATKVYFKPVVGEHVYCLMDKHLETGVVAGALYSDRDSEPGDGSSQLHIETAGGTKIIIDADGKVQMYAGDQISITADNTINIQADAINLNGTVNISGGIQADTIHATGDIKSDSEVVANGSNPATAVHLSTHIHTGVQTGGGVTLTPQPGS